MSELTLFPFERDGCGIVWARKADLDDIVSGWESLRKHMIRQVPDAFSREEWAYLILFLQSCSLRAYVTDAFGQGVAQSSVSPRFLIRDRGLVAIWLPNNVSLLGPLVLVLVSLMGNPMRLKGGSRGDDLTGPFLAFAREHLPAGPLRDYLESSVDYAQFDHTDTRTQAMARDAAVRIFFGGDEAAEAVERLPHPTHSVGYAFTDRVSEVWLDKDALDDASLSTLLSVFAIYGQAGCTSPKFVVLLDGTADEAAALAERLAGLWPSVVRKPVEPHTASASLLATQWAKAVGYRPFEVEGAAAVIAAGAGGGPAPIGNLVLPVVVGSLSERAASLGDKVQTIAHNASGETFDRIVRAIAPTAVKRLVPIAQMHHFGPVWDGYPFLEGLVEKVEMQA